VVVVVHGIAEEKEREVIALLTVITTALRLLTSTTTITVGKSYIWYIGAAHYAAVLFVGVGRPAKGAVESRMSDT